MSEKSSSEIYAEMLKEGEKKKEFGKGNPKGEVTASYGVDEDYTLAEKAFMTRKRLERSGSNPSLLDRIKNRKGKK